jgi:hypothetical protein
MQGQYTGKMYTEKWVNYKLANLVQGLLADYSKEHQVTRPSEDDNTVAKADRATFPKKIPPTARTLQPIKQSVVCNQYRKR